MTQGAEGEKTPVETIKARIEQYSTEQRQQRLVSRVSFASSAAGVLSVGMFLFTEAFERKSGISVNQAGLVFVEYSKSQLELVIGYGSALILTVGTALSTGIGVGAIQKEKDLGRRAAALENALAEHALSNHDSTIFAEPEQTPPSGPAS